DRASALYQRGISYIASDEPHRALAEFQRMMAVAPDRVAGPLMTSVTEIQMEHLERAAAEAERGLARHPGDPRLMDRLATLYVLNRNRARAAELCNAWRKRDPNAAEPLRILGQVAREQQRLPDAARYGEQALAKAPDDASVCYELARTLAA